MERLICCSYVNEKRKTKGKNQLKCMQYVCKLEKILLFIGDFVSIC
jgi:hypothetical protein